MRGWLHVMTMSPLVILTSIAVLYFNYREERSVLIDLGVWLSLALTLASAADYFFRLRKLINEPI